MSTKKAQCCILAQVNILVDFWAKRAYTNETERANKNKKLQIPQGFEQTSWGWTWRGGEGF